jgi:outer membrane protein assembly factor BamB
VVWGDRVFVTSAVEADEDQVRGRRPGRLAFVLLCFDRATGDLLWQRTAIEATPHEGTHSTNGYASASPCTDGEHVYAHFGSRGVFCYTMDGQLVWQRDLGDMKTRATFGEGASPTLVDGKLVVPWDHEGPSSLYALDKATGETIWRVERDEPTCWATPLVIEQGGRKQVVMNGQNYARAYDLDSGRELWRCGGQTERPVASAVAGDGIVFIGSGFRGSFLGAFRPDGQGDIAGTSHVVWTVSRDTPDIASPLLSGSRLYFYKGKSGLLTCLDAKTGAPHYTTQRTGLGTIYASPVAAGGYVYLTDRSGTTVVVRDADDFEIVATNSVGETVDATPAPVDDQLFIRGEKHLFCISR